MQRQLFWVACCIMGLVGIPFGLGKILCPLYTKLFHLKAPIRDLGIWLMGALTLTALLILIIVILYLLWALALHDAAHYEEDDQEVYDGE